MTRNVLTRRVKNAMTTAARATSTPTALLPCAPALMAICGVLFGNYVRARDLAAVQDPRPPSERCRKSQRTRVEDTPRRCSQYGRERVRCQPPSEPPTAQRSE